MASIMRNAVSVIESIRIILIDCLSVPKIIGTGPIIIAPPPFTFPPPFLVLDMKSKIIATKIMSIPAKIKANPNPKSVDASISVKLRLCILRFADGF
jgi:hypothetical protein